jgi:hypothetical protein
MKQQNMHKQMEPDPLNLCINWPAMSWKKGVFIANSSNTKIQQSLQKLDETKAIKQNNLLLLQGWQNLWDSLMMIDDEYGDSSNEHFSRNKRSKKQSFASPDLKQRHC